jgi:hypothetical protein
MLMKARSRISANFACKDLLGHTIAAVMRGAIAFYVLCYLLPLKAIVLAYIFLNQYY